MASKITLVLTPEQAADASFYTPLAAKKAGLQPENVALLRVTGRSIDARRGAPKVNLTVEIFADDDEKPEPAHFEFQDVRHKAEVIVVGGGPAGLFAALRLIELGLRPIVLERGKRVAERKRDIAQLCRNVALDPESNYAFGEGGAGTFSDGKLFTRSKKRGDYQRILQWLVHHGASEQILVDAHPHIGSDRLPGVMTRIRQTIEDAGGAVVFGARVSDFELREGRLVAVHAAGVRYAGAAVVLATGHSARDVYELLNVGGVHLEAKPFAVGVRIEHPQALIDRIQYRQAARGEYLPAASYSVVSQELGRGVYSFCMCPGGIMVPALTDPGQAVVNGMSASARNSTFANAGLVVEVRTEDFAAADALAGLRFQERLEMVARENCTADFSAPAQRTADFVAGRASVDLPRASYLPGLWTSRLDQWMPSFVASTLRAGLKTFDRKMHGFLTNESVVVGVESRTSTPVRIPRDADSLMSDSTEGLFPAGEGAGYAGGIVSAALDGARVAEAVFNWLGK